MSLFSALLSRTSRKTVLNRPRADPSLPRSVQLAYIIPALSTSSIYLYMFVYISDLPNWFFLSPYRPSPPILASLFSFILLSSVLSARRACMRVCIFSTTRQTEIMFLLVAYDSDINPVFGESVLFRVSLFSWLVLICQFCTSALRYKTM